MSQIQEIPKTEIVKSCGGMGAEYIDRAFKIALQCGEIERKEAIKVFHGIGCKIEGMIAKLEPIKPKVIIPAEVKS